MAVDGASPDRTEPPACALSSPEQDGFVGLRYAAPPEALRDHFGSLYHFSARRAAFEDRTRADVAQLRFILAGSGHYRFHDGRKADTPAVCMLGPTMGATGFYLTGPAEVIGISLLPLGWVALDGGDASAWADDLYDAGRDQAFCDLLEALRSKGDLEEAKATIWAFIGARLQPVSPAIWRFVAATDAWLADEGNPRVDALVAATDLSARQVARLANRLYGGPPKLLARKYRALRCAAKIVIDRQPWQELCDNGTFYDQSHFIREIKHFIGLTPHQLMTDPTDVARLTLQRRDMSGKVAEINRIS